MVIVIVTSEGNQVHGFEASYGRSRLLFDVDVYLEVEGMSRGSAEVVMHAAVVFNFVQVLFLLRKFFPGSMSWDISFLQ